MCVDREYSDCWIGGRKNFWKSFDTHRHGIYKYINGMTNYYYENEFVKNFF